MKLRGGIEIEMKRWMCNVGDIAFDVYRFLKSRVSNTVVIRNLEAVSQIVWMLLAVFIVRFSL